MSQLWLQMFKTQSFLFSFLTHNREYWNPSVSSVVVANSFSRLPIRLRCVQPRSYQLYGPHFLWLITYKNVHWTVFEGNSMGLIKIHNGRNYAHAQDSNAYIFC